MTLFTEATAVAAKDLRIEARGHRIAGSVLPLAGALIVAFAVVAAPDPARTAQTVPALGWITVVFATVLALKRAHDAESEDGALEGLLLAPVRRSAIYLGKVLALATELLVVQAALLAVAAVFAGPPSVAGLAATILGTAGLAAVGALFGLMTESAHARGATLPLLMLPAAAPVPVFAIKAGEGHAGLWLPLLLLFDAVVLAVGALAARHVVED